MLREEEIFRGLANRELTKTEALELLKQLREGAPAPKISASEVNTAVAEIVCKILRLEEDEMDVDRNFIELGADSITGLEILREINTRYGLKLNVVLFYEYTTVTTLAEYVALQLTKTNSSKAQTQAEAETKPPSEPEPVQVRPSVIHPSPSDLEGVAVIGMSGRFPGASNVRQYWKNLRDGVDAVIEVPKDRWNIDELYDPTPHTDNKTYCRTGGFLTDIDQFDPLFFNISPAEAETMDPQQRLFLQEAWKALEDAGYSDRSLSEQKCGVFIGVTPSDYGNLLAKQGLDTKGEAMTGLASSILAARISYFLNLIGPNISVDTACSSSLVSVHLAMQSILSGESDMALAGGVSLFFTPEFNLQAAMMEMLSPSGKCRTFDRSADGTVFSEGVGVIVLKPLRKAIADRDHIYGVIRGTGVNQDGKTNGITAPSAASQTRLMLDIYKRFHINAADISYVEAHGTATPLGDPIEVKALSQAFSTFTDEKQYCAIGSVKTNIGHGYTASGIMALIKVLLSLQHKQIPASLHYETPNQHIDFADSPFYVNDKLSEWKTKSGVPRMATVSSFALSGTNAHVVVQEAPQD